MDKNVQLHGRSPYGERGLKFIETNLESRVRRRSPYGERGLKYDGKYPTERGVRRSPYGERGLKWNIRCEETSHLVALLTESVD